MKHFVMYAFTVIMTISTISCIETKPKLDLRTDTEVISYESAGKKGFWGVDPKTSFDVLKVECFELENTVVFKSDIDSISFRVREGDTLVFNVILNQIDTAVTAIVGIPKKIYNHDPLKANIHTEDVERFWQAYDKVQVDPDNANQIYADEYITGGSEGWQDYFRIKILDTISFSKHYKERPKFYESIRGATQSIESIKPMMYESFKSLKDYFPESRFPEIYLVMGAFTSAGTVSDSGLLIGLNQISRTDESITDELTLWQNNNFLKYENLPNVIAHELIHFQQYEMASDSTALRTAIVEGMADFLGELIMGEKSSNRVAVWAKGRENEIRKRFETDMLFARSYNWIANSDQETEDFPADQGYWVGYEICKDYYEKSTDKKQAIKDMLSISDYQAFLEASDWLNKTY